MPSLRKSIRIPGFFKAIDFAQLSDDLEILANELVRHRCQAYTIDKKQTALQKSRPGVDLLQKFSWMLKYVKCVGLTPMHVQQLFYLYLLPQDLVLTKQLCRIGE